MKKKKIIRNLVIIITVLLLLRACFYKILYIDVTPLPAIHSAAYSGQNNYIKFLLIFNNVNSNKYDNETPLIWAIKGNQLESVKLLLKRGADIEYNSSRFDTVPHTPLHYAIREGNIEIIEYLLYKGASLEITHNALDTAVSKGHTEIVKILIDLGVDLNHKDFMGTSPLIEACRSFYLSDYIDGKRVHNKNYNTVIDILINEGANIHETNDDGNSTLIYASMLGNLEAVKKLVVMGVDIMHKNNEGKTALFYANEREKNDIVKYLIQQGAE